MEMNTILDWAILFSVVQLCIWQILHMRKSKTTFGKFDKIDAVLSDQVKINVSFYNRLIALEKEQAKCPHTDTAVKS